MTDQKKHILILPRWYPNKTDVQLGTFIRQQARLLKNDFQIHVIYVQADPDLQGPFQIVRNQEDGIDEQIVYFRQSKGVFRKPINANRYRKAQRLAFSNIQDKIDLCHVHVPYRSAFLALDLHKTGVPYVITEHWSGHLTGEFEAKNSLDKKIYLKVCKQAAAISCVSQKLAEAFLKHTGIEPTVIPNIIETAKGPVPERKRETIEILTVSDLRDEVKNISGLLKAFRDAVNENPLLRLSIVGGGPDFKFLIDQSKSLGLEDVVHFTGRLSHEMALEMYLHCDFYICNSRFETFGMAVAEAICAGKPVISTRCGGPEEFVNSNNGILVEIHDPESLKSAILDLGSTFMQYEANNLKQEMTRRFGPEEVRKQLVKFYSDQL